LVKDKRSLFYLYAATFGVFLNFYLAQTITPLYILEVGGTEFFSGLQSTLFFLTAVILRFYFGPLADRKGNKLILLIGAAAFTTAPFLFLFSDDLWYIILVRIYQSIGLAAYFSSSASLASALAPPEQLGRYIGFYRFVIMSTLIIGPSAALKVIEYQGYQFYHILGIAVGIFSMLGIFRIKEPEPPASSQSLATTSGAKASPFSMLSLLKDKLLTPVYLSIFVVSVVYGLVLTFVAIYIQQWASGINPGIFFTLFGLGSVVSNLVAGPISDRKGRPVVAFPCIALMGLGVAVFFYLPLSPLVIYTGSILAGIGYAGGIVVLISWIVDIITPFRRTTALALQDSAVDIGIALGSFLFGIIIPLIGMPWSFGLSGLILVVFAIGMIILISGKINKIGV
jgi:MFS family permease